MTRSIVLFTLIIKTVASADTQNLEFIDFKVRGDQNVWTYLVVCQKSCDSLTVWLEIPRAAYVKPVTSTTEGSLEERDVTSTKKDSLKEKKSVTSTKKDSKQKKRVTPKMEYSLRQERLPDGTLKVKIAPSDTAKQTSTFEVIAPKNMTKNGEIGWTINSDPKETKRKVPGPIALNNPIIRPVLAMGGSWRFRVTDFKVENNAVLIKYDGNFRPSFSAGLMLNCLNLNNKLNADLLLSFEFGIDSPKIIDGFVGGLTFRVFRYHDFRLPELFVGISSHTMQKLRSGFKKAAKKLANDINAMSIDSLSELNTEDNKINPEAIKWNFKHFRKLNKSKDYDGFPTIDPRDGSPIFYGTPLIDYTNWAFVCGVAVPLDLGNWIPNLIAKIVGG